MKLRPTNLINDNDKFHKLETHGYGQKGDQQTTLDTH